MKRTNYSFTTWFLICLIVSSTLLYPKRLMAQNIDLLPREQKQKIVECFDDLKLCKTSLIEAETPPVDHSMTVVVSTIALLLGFALGHSIH